jgi:hypothetical protein
MSSTDSLISSSYEITTTPFISSLASTTSQISAAINGNTSFTIYSVLNINHTGNQLNGVLTTYTGDLSACLSNCSNQGICVINLQQQYICVCNQYKTGVACQSDLRPCSSNPCLNNGTCSNLVNNNETSFQCICQNNLFYGTYCENKNDSCLNNTEVCIKNQGYCIMNGTQPMCKCLMDYFGTKCEIMSTSLVVKNFIINASTIIAIIVLVCFIILVLCFDYTKYFMADKDVTIKMNYEQYRQFRYHP